MKHSPRQYAEALYLALDGKAPARRAEILKNFMKVLDKNHDSNLAKRILIDFEKVTLAKEGVKKVDIESASPLTESVRKDIETKLGGKVLMTEKVNPELIAGLTILVNDSRFIDASARTQINNIF